MSYIHDNENHTSNQSHIQRAIGYPCARPMSFYVNVTLSTITLKGQNIFFYMNFKVVGIIKNWMPTIRQNNANFIIYWIGLATASNETIQISVQQLIS